MSRKNGSQSHIATFCQNLYYNTARYATMKLRDLINGGTMSIEEAQEDEEYQRMRFEQDLWALTYKNLTGKMP
jgi:hypothetical protein